MNKFIKQFDEITRHDVNLAGGKGASLGELTRAGIQVENAVRQTIKTRVYCLVLIGSSREL